MSNRFKQLRPDRRGLTLVEMMVSLTIFGIVLGVAFSFMSSSRQSYDKTRDQAQFQQSMRAVMSLVSREIRSIGCDPNDVGFDSFAMADDDMFQCRMDLNGDADFTDMDPDESVTYRYDPGQSALIRNGGGADQVILRNVGALTFRYYDAAGDPLNATPLSAVDRAQVRFVEFAITSELDDETDISYTTRVALRNI